jgi:phage terminase large subunit-like protein
MVRTTLASVRPDIAVTEVTSRRGKALRADPIAALYEQGRVHHVGLFNELEDQMTSWVLGESSPDRLDALVHALTYLSRGNQVTEISSPLNLPRIPQ